MGVFIDLRDIILGTCPAIIIISISYAHCFCEDIDNSVDMFYNHIGYTDTDRKFFHVELLHDLLDLHSYRIYYRKNDTKRFLYENVGSYEQSFYPL